MKHSILILFLSLFIFYSCKKENSEPETSGGTSQTIIPFAQGNFWNYHSIMIPQQDTNYYSNWISGDTTIGTEYWFKLFSGDSINYVFERNKADGLHQFTVPGDIDDLIFKYPAAVGDHYFTNTNPDTVLVQNIDTLISVPAGQFSCYEYKIQEFGNYFLVYVSPGAGFIKAYAYINGTLTTVNELTNYHLE